MKVSNTRHIKSYLLIAVAIGLNIVIFSYGWTQSHNLKRNVIAPNQEEYRADSTAQKIFQFLSERWKSDSADLYILVANRGQAYQELGVVDSAQLSSARIFVPTEDFPNLQTLKASAVAHEGNVYLLNEFRPTTDEQKETARQFYSAQTMFPNKSQAFAIIVWWNVNASGDGTIKALTNAGYLTVPVKHWLPLKHSAYIDD